MALTDKVSVDTLMRVRKMPRDDAKALLDKYDLSPEEWEQAEKLLDPPPEGNPKWDNRLWVGVAWLLGASNRQIAMDKGVTRQTIFDQVTRFLSPEDKKARLRGYLSLESYSTYKVAFFENVEKLRTMTPAQAAMWLFVTVDLDE
jgi:hypothetical protein